MNKMNKMNKILIILVSSFLLIGCIKQNNQAENLLIKKEKNRSDSKISIPVIETEMQNEDRNSCITSYGKLLDGDILRTYSKFLPEGATIFKCKNGKFEKIKTGIKNSDIFIRREIRGDSKYIRGKSEKIEAGGRSFKGCNDIVVCNEKSLEWYFSFRSEDNMGGVACVEEYWNNLSSFQIPDELKQYLQNFIGCDHLLNDKIFIDHIKIVEKKLKLKIKSNPDYGYKPFYYDIKKWGFPDYTVKNENEIIFTVSNNKDIKNLFRVLWEKSDWIISIEIIS